MLFARMRTSRSTLYQCSMNKKKIAITHPFFGIYNRGTETFFMEITEYLRQYYDITVFSLADDKTIHEHIRLLDNVHKGRLLTLYFNIYDRSPRLHRLLNKNRYLTCLQPMAFYYRKIARRMWKQYLSKEHYDLIFSSMGGQGAALADRYRKKTGAPYIYKGGGGIGPGERVTLDKHPDMFICVSSSQQEWASAYTPNTVMIPNGTYIDRFTGEMDKEPYYINKGHKLILAVGNLDMDFKRMQLVIEAVSRIEDADLLILGRGKDEDRLRALAEEKLPGRHEIKGVHFTETPYYYRSADVFTLASLYEPFGIVYIEAMASGLPIVTTNDDVRREIVGNAGIVCDVTDTEAYAAALKEALSTDWKDIPSGRAVRYDYSTIGEEYHELIEKLLAGHH